MNLKINMNNVKVSDNAQLFSNMGVHGNVDADIQMDSVEIKNNASVFKNIDIEDFIDNVESVIDKMELNTNEYAELNKVVKEAKNDRSITPQKIANKIGEISQGVLENVIAMYIGRGF